MPDFSHSSLSNSRYIWKANGTQVGTGAAYTVSAADLGKAITLEVTSSVETGTLTSVATNPVRTPSQDIYTVTYNPNGGYGAMAPQTVTSGASLTIAYNSFSRPDYVFVGWNTTYDGRGISYAGGQTISLMSNLTLFAQWVYSPYISTPTPTPYPEYTPQQTPAPTQTPASHGKISEIKVSNETKKQDVLIDLLFQAMIRIKITNHWQLQRLTVQN